MIFFLLTMWVLHAYSLFFYLHVCRHASSVTGDEQLAGFYGDELSV